MINHLVLFGATGDLAGRFLLPALVELASEKFLSEDFAITATAESLLDDAEFRSHAEGCLRKFARHLPTSAHQKVLKQCRYQPGDATQASDLQQVLAQAATQPALFYLALPPEAVPATLRALVQIGLHPGSRIAIEKPFGQDLKSATKLAEVLTELFGDDNCETIFNVDHVLGRSSVQALTQLRSYNPLLEAIWNTEYIAEFNILWEEKLALEGRVDFYDRTGALKDVMQNHLMQVLSLSAMELPGNRLHGTSVKDDARRRKLDVLRAVRCPSNQEAMHNSRRARYTAGMLTDDSSGSVKSVEGYLEAPGVNVSHDTETLAEVLVNIDTPRWAGTRFRLRTGKALAKLRKGIEIHFHPFNNEAPGSKLWIGLNGPNSVELLLHTGDVDGELTALQLAGMQPAPRASPYANVLKNCMQYGNELSVSVEEAVLAWQILTPFSKAWSRGDVPMETYPASSTPPYLNPRE